MIYTTVNGRPIPPPSTIPDVVPFDPSAFPVVGNPPEKAKTNE